MHECGRTEKERGEKSKTAFANFLVNIFSYVLYKVLTQDLDPIIIQMYSITMARN